MPSNTVVFASCPVNSASLAKARVQVIKNPGRDSEGKMENE